jgi:acyl-CoA thioester hydrolase
LGKSSADAVFELYNNANGVLLAKGGLTQVFVDPTTRQSMPIPEFYRANIIEQQESLGN